MKAVIFSIAEKVYGVDISQVREVLRMRRITAIPDVSGFIEGVISLRGKVIPLLDLRKKLGLDSKITATSRILVSEVQGHPAGFLVDRVQDVESLPDDAMTRPDDLLRSAHYLVAVTKWEGKLVLIIDLAALLRDEERTSLEAVQSRVAVKKKDVQG